MTNQPHANQSHSNTDEFYVGYLPIPRGHRRFIIALIAGLGAWSLAMAIIITMTMRAPGAAQWNTGKVQTWSGTLFEHPYPLLAPDDQSQAALLVVSMGKRGAHARLASAFGKHVTLTGFELNRDGRHLIELEDSESAINIDPSTATVPLQNIQPSKHARYTGEIVDGKCFLGAMKPGDGIGHRSCAVLCIRGGLPPMFVSYDTNDQPEYALLVVDGSTTLDEHIFGLVGQPVIIDGQYSDLFGIRVLNTSKSSIQRSYPSKPNP